MATTKNKLALGKGMSALLGGNASPIMSQPKAQGNGSLLVPIEKVDRKSTRLNSSHVP